MNNSAFTIETVEFVDGGNDQVADARLRYKREFPGRSARRMTHLGMLVGLCLQRMNIDRGTPVIYASAFAESASLERFIDSFPEASPALFQSSIHPSAVEQALIPGKKAIDRFYPVTSEVNLAGQALENCFLMADAQVVLVGGEERGTWLCPFDLASEKSFAFSMKMNRNEQGIGTVTVDSSVKPSEIEPMDLPSLTLAIKRRESVVIPAFAMDSCLRIDWK